MGHYQGSPRGAYSQPPRGPSLSSSFCLGRSGERKSTDYSSQTAFLVISLSVPPSYHHLNKFLLGLAERLKGFPSGELLWVFVESHVLGPACEG